jgi:Bacterial SH3 domain
MATQFRVAATALNLRSTPRVEPTNRVAVLPQGTIVEKLSETAAADWWEVAATLQNARAQGFVNARHLAPASNPEPVAPARAAQAVHLREGRAEITRDSGSGRAFPLGEPSRPRTPTGTAAERKAGLLQIIDWLDVENGARWRPTSVSTFCNIYAFDVCYLAGAYLPRVWWKSKALAALARGEDVVPRYDDTLHELNANALCDWFEDHGPAFGWERALDPNALQTSANAGGLAVIVAQRVDLNRSGHIQIIAPEHGPFSARRTNGQVVMPLQSQAGSSNFRYGFLGRSRWWAVTTRFRKHGFWIQRD